MQTLKEIFYDMKHRRVASAKRMIERIVGFCTADGPANGQLCGVTQYKYTIKYSYAYAFSLPGLKKLYEGIVRSGDSFGRTIQVIGYTGRGYPIDIHLTLDIHHWDMLGEAKGGTSEGVETYSEHGPIYLLYQEKV